MMVGNDTREGGRVLIGCECSGRVRDAFRERGIDAVSCDLNPTERPGPHIQGDVREVLNDGWDAAIMFPDCTYLCSSGLHWNRRRPDRAQLTSEAVAFVEALWAAPVPRMAIENPIGCLSTQSTLGAPSQIVQPWQHGDDASKATCLWLRGLPRLLPTGLAAPRMVMYGEHAGKLRWGNQTDSGQNALAPSPDRAANRARTYHGIALAMAAQWAPALLDTKGRAASKRIAG